VKRGLLVAAGVAAFLVFLVAMVPAGQLAGRLPAGVELSGLGGTIWSGQAGSLTVNGRALGALAWSCRPWPLVVLEWSCRLTLEPPGGGLTGELSGDFGGDIVAEDVRGRVPVSLFEGGTTPRGWSGELELDLAQVHVVDRRPAAARGTIFARGLRASGPNAQLLGDFELVVGEGTVGGAALNGRLRDLGGPLHVRGAVELDASGRYFLTGDAAPGPGAGPAIFESLSFLGPPDAQGRRPFAIEGTL
jgi:general secretion pathway protein N